MRNAELIQLMKESFNATLEYVDYNTGVFTLKTPVQLPEYIAQISTSFSVQISEGLNLRGYSHHEQSHTSYRYSFLLSSEGQLLKAMEHELEKKRYRDFSRTFDAEVQSELGTIKD